jgi:hypothetical protein
MIDAHYHADAKIVPIQKATSKCHISRVVGCGKLSLLRRKKAKFSF